MALSLWLQLNAIDAVLVRCSDPTPLPSVIDQGSQDTHMEQRLAARFYLINADVVVAMRRGLVSLRDSSVRLRDATITQERRRNLTANMYLISR